MTRTLTRQKLAFNTATTKPIKLVAILIFWTLRVDEDWKSAQI
jgi:hypothetical protein